SWGMARRTGLTHQDRPRYHREPCWSAAAKPDMPAKGKGDPKASAFGIPLGTWGEQAEAAHARATATSIFFSLASPLAVVSRSGSRSQPWPTCEHCAANLMKGLPKSAKHLLEINAEFPQARPSRSSLS